MKNDSEFTTGLSIRSFIASIVGMFIVGVYIQVVEVLMAAGSPAEQALPIPVMFVLLLLIIISLLFSLIRFRVLNKAELLCVFFAMMISAPIMTQGMWHRFVGLISAPVRTNSFSYIDSYNDKFWPHGVNLLTSKSSDQEKKFVLTNDKDSKSESKVDLEVVSDENRLLGGKLYLFSVLVAPNVVSSDTRVKAHLYEDNNETFVEFFNVSGADFVGPTAIHPDGSMRLGKYGVAVNQSLKNKIRIEIILEGAGEIVLSDLKFMDVSSLENIYSGRKMISESEWLALPEEHRPVDVIVKPDEMFSLKGVKFLLSGYIPWKDWITPIFTWGSFVILLLTATLSIMIIFRKQWADNERFTFPLTKVPSKIIGLDEKGDHLWASIWKNSYFWYGLIFAVTWGGLKGWHYFNSDVPNTNIDIPLSPYFTDGQWGEMWHTSFIVSIFIVSLAIFFELNVLLSLLIGFWLFRSQFWIGEFTDWKTVQGYPFRYEQALGAYLGYFIVILFVSRKFLLLVMRKAIKGERDPNDFLSMRTAMLLLFFSFFSAALWALWVGTSVISILIFFSLLVSIGLVSAKLRAECGIPGGYFTPYNAMVFIALLGGISAFGPSAMLISLLLSGFLTVSVFFFIPGMQLEFIQLSKGLRVRSSHIISFIYIGIIGGLLIGGYVFLSNAYSIGGDNIRYQWAFNQEWYLSSFKSELSKANEDMNISKEKDVGVLGIKDWVLIMSGGVTMLVSALRQWFSGFWFHPIGVIVGSSYMMSFCWGSILIAWIIRFTTLKLKGVKGVKNNLYPFFTGTLIGAVIIASVFYLVGIIDLVNGMSIFYKDLP